MKKLTLALVASAVTISAASANISTGFYLGAAGGYGATTGKLTGQYQNGTSVVGSTDIGGGAGNIGVHAGYGHVSGCFYVGGELAYTFENTKINSTLFGSATQSSAQLKRNGYFNAALRGGWLFTPNTMGYIRLGANWGKWTLDDRLNVFTNAMPGRGSKSRASFAPGAGIETSVARNVYLRVEYTYEFGPSVRALNAAAPNAFLNAGQIRTQSGKVGLSYKF